MTIQIERALQIEVVDAMTLDEAKAAIERVVAAQPELTDFGFGVYDARRKTAEQRAAEFATNRALMFEPRSLDQFIAACGWLNRHKKIKRLNHRSSSYGLKHRAQHSIGYVTNGMFIAAAVTSGFRVHRCSPTSPNAWFNISSTAWGQTR